MQDNPQSIINATVALNILLGASVSKLCWNDVCVKKITERAIYKAREALIMISHNVLFCSIIFLIKNYLSILKFKRHLLNLLINWLLLN